MGLVVKVNREATSWLTEAVTFLPVGTLTKEQNLHALKHCRSTLHRNREGREGGRGCKERKSKRKEGGMTSTGSQDAFQTGKQKNPEGNSWTERGRGRLCPRLPTSHKITRDAL